MRDRVNVRVLSTQRWATQASTHSYGDSKRRRTELRRGRLGKRLRRRRRRRHRRRRPRRFLWGPGNADK